MSAHDPSRERRTGVPQILHAIVGRSPATMAASARGLSLLQSEPGGLREGMAKTAGPTFRDALGQTAGVNGG